MILNFYIILSFIYSPKNILIKSSKTSQIPQYKKQISKLHKQNENEPNSEKKNASIPEKKPFFYDMKKIRNEIIQEMSNITKVNKENLDKINSFYPIALKIEKDYSNPEGKNDPNFIQFCSSLKNMMKTIDNYIWLKINPVLGISFEHIILGENYEGYQNSVLFKISRGFQKIERKSSMNSFLPESKKKEKSLLGVLRGMNKEIFEILQFFGNLADWIMFLIINRYDKFFLKVDLLHTLENVREIHHPNEDFITEEELDLWKTITGIRIRYSYLIKFEECRHVSDAINIGVCGNQGVISEEFLKGIKKIAENTCNEIAGKLLLLLEEFMGNFFSKILSLDTSKMKGKIVDCVDSYIKEFETKEHNIYLQMRS